MKRAKQTLRQDWRSVVLGLFFPLLLGCAGCAARLETANGSTWIAGLSRVAVDAREFGDHSFIVHEESQSAPLELRCVPYGFSLSLADAKHAEERVLEARERDRFVPRRDFGIALGNGPRPWRFGLTYYRAPRRNARTLARVNTIRGVAIRLAHEDSFLTAGASRTCVTAMADGDQDALICYDVTRRFAKVKITKPQPGELIP